MNEEKPRGIEWEGGNPFTGEGAKKPPEENIAPVEIKPRERDPDEPNHFFYDEMRVELNDLAERVDRLHMRLYGRTKFVACAREALRVAGHEVYKARRAMQGIVDDG